MTKVIGIALAEYANRATGHAYPGLRRLGRDTVTSHSNAQRAVRLLRERGHLDVELRTHPAGGADSSLYYPLVDGRRWSAAPVDKPVDKSRGGVSELGYRVSHSSDTGVYQHVIHKNLRTEPYIEPSGARATPVEGRRARPPPDLQISDEDRRAVASKMQQLADELRPRKA